MSRATVSKSGDEHILSLQPWNQPGVIALEYLHQVTGSIFEYSFLRIKRGPLQVPDHPAYDHVITADNGSAMWMVADSEGHQHGSLRIPLGLAVAEWLPGFFTTFLSWLDRHAQQELQRQLLTDETEVWLISSGHVYGNRLVRIRYQRKAHQLPELVITSWQLHVVPDIN